MTIELRTTTRLFGLAVALLVAVTSVNAAREPATQAAPADTVWAESVVSFKPGAGTIGANFSDPANALGPVDAYIVSMGNAQIPSAPPDNPAACEAVLILSFGANNLIDGEGDDLIIYESAVGSLLEPTWVYIGSEQTGWRYLVNRPEVGIRWTSAGG
ncbi:MAG: hypothetical protein R3C44_22565 [Chloroflexota bacterium]